MEFSEIEKELLAGFLGTNWSEFVEFAEDFVPESALHRLAEKLGLDNAN